MGAPSSVTITANVWVEAADASGGQKTVIVEPKTTTEHVFSFAASLPSASSKLGHSLVPMTPLAIVVPNGDKLYLRTLRADVASSAVVSEGA